MTTPSRLDDALAAARATASAVRVSHQLDPISTNSASGCYRADDLADPATGLAQQVIAAHCQSRGLQLGRHGASLAFQRYAHKLAGMVIPATALGGVLPDVSLAHSGCRFVKANPYEVLLSGPRLIDAPTVEDIATLLVDAHLEPMARTWSAAGKVSMRNLWGNIAASLALGIRRVAPLIGIEPARELGEQLAASRAALRGLGNYRVVSSGAVFGLFFDRNSCCQWYAARDGKFCSWCCRRPADERLAAYREQLANS